jgi:type IV pilus assembly protein PilN
LGTVVTLTGKAETNERVSEFLRNTLYNSPWLERPELVEIKAAAARQDGGPAPLFDFSMKVYIKQPGAAAGRPAMPLRVQAGAKSAAA